ncbi:UbiH/UbiF/VisC/COQ6 family ubiquinone biosynthesis hydroxylase [Massilia sp. TS11]|uniref:UbiH/UbiF/VisC/COQ6 family ubiquinone biosynthesis hydroxylase n=1 Tax=Massilia sp. TS11 TaxID=2908003 RepID=UPI001EDB1740|nr:UbiH/UbiF/VisC/COQ6 family ubiquinone biosynthesis hydroxylase [Massilia sp. TS11]MCG2586715.1 UbiH/UbiF/VisC/COQ6 family ubiquinone biosynthesis hydroxylase [Massilia sp. TS11]
MTEQHFDTAICGAGPVGMALAALLARRGMAPARIALIDARPLEQAIDDPRSIALSYGSRQLLEQLGAWPLPATPIEQIHVSRRGHFGRSLIDRTDHDLPALGYVCRYGDVVAALARACAAAGISTLRPARVAGHLEDSDSVQLHLDDGRNLSAAIVVQAEGGVFSDQSERSLRRDYAQTGIIARVAVSAPQLTRAFERFTEEGPLALLPQSGSDGLHYALVWCVRPERAEQLLALDDTAFLQALEAAFGQRLGQFQKTSARLGYPLGLNAEARATARTVAIGNAAQTLHPVAGQGMNLGLRDAAVLAPMLARSFQPPVLAEYATARMRDRHTTVHLTDTLARIFAQRGPLQHVLGAGLAVLDTLDPARAILAELMMFGRR